MLALCSRSTSGLAPADRVEGLTISEVERIGVSETIYFAFITGLTIGHGDITPDTIWGRAVSVAIGLVGMIFTRITVAVATRALSELAGRHQEYEQ